MLLEKVLYLDLEQAAIYLKPTVNPEKSAHKKTKATRELVL
jgi:hypothetical protein